jgi:hypothetical protein
MNKIALTENLKNYNNSRGFLSNYTTILTSFRYLTQNKNVDPNDIFISSSMFSLYGNPKEWFDSDRIVDFFDDNYISHHSVIGFDLSIWPTSNELDLFEYIKYIPFNSRVKKLLGKDNINYSNTLGIHYRGTDNRGNNGHTDYLPLNKIIQSSDEEFSKNFYDSIFICTDENGVIEKIKEHFLKKYNFTNINYFNHIRTDGEVALHFTDFSKKEKVLLGDQVLIDSTTLSKCKTVIGKTSNIINYARIINPKLEVLYQDLDTVKMDGNLNNKFLQIRTCEIQPFIFNWKNQFKKTCAIEDSLKKIFDKVIVINSDEENTRDGWLDVGDSAYFTKQFTKALELFEDDKKVLMHIQGDTVYNNYKQLVEDAKKYYSIYEWGVYAPDITNVWYTSEIVDISEVQSEHENIKMVACTDETVWFIHKNIIDDYYKRGLSEIMTSEKMKMGWGWDLVMNSISFVKGMPVIRDYNHQIQHAKGTNYSKNSASKEMENLWNGLPDDLKECISYIKNDKEKLVKYFE